jgi:hypothetical protein
MLGRLVDIPWRPFVMVIDADGAIVSLDTAGSSDKLREVVLAAVERFDDQRTSEETGDRDESQYL